MVFLLFLYIQTINSQLTTTSTPTFLYGCSFVNRTYLASAAVANQFQFVNSSSVKLIASYSFLSSTASISTFEVGLIYPFSTSTYLVPFPIILDCGSIVSSCQLQTVAGSTLTSRYSEPIVVPLTPFNYSSSSISLNQMGLYLRQGQYQLSNCSINNGQYMTDPQTIFNIEIDYEKPVGTLCNPLTDTCGSSSLTTCSSTLSTCTCLSANSLVSYSNSFYCADTLNTSACTIFPTRCITWCNSTSNYLCICPSDTLKIQRNNSYVCELPVDSTNCSNTDTIRRCPFGQSCLNNQCTDDAIITTTKTTNANSSSDLPLRIVLGIIAGLLGTSILVLIGAFCWVRQRHKHRRAVAEKSLSSLSVTPSSAIYMSPTLQKQQQQQQRRTSLSNQIYQLPNNSHDEIFSPIYRTNSFRQAIRSGYHRTSQTIEHVSAKRDSFIDKSPYDKEYLESANYSTLQYITPTQTTPNQKSTQKNNHNIYQVFLPPSSPPILTHHV
ncbi:unnamed protein product [Adineta ricciae]|uniref:Uncharacterized protein n=1 Tax=Adineta ricciae TaxID=249248 RepID=A0A816CGH9_ADIRI|nr:unnamed protein product [Adineta ricciae]CAF1620030.1 unnamed protein product [Adineta ricciae]